MPIGPVTPLGPSSPPGTLPLTSSLIPWKMFLTALNGKLAPLTNASFTVRTAQRALTPTWHCFAAASHRGVTMTWNAWPLACTPPSTIAAPGAAFSRLRSWSGEVIGLPSTVRSWSPFRIPAAAAGEFGTTPMTLPGTSFSWVRS